MPVFTFAYAVAPLVGLGLGDLLQPLTLSILLGLILGIALAVLAAIKLKAAKLPAGPKISALLVSAGSLVPGIAGAAINLMVAHSGKRQRHEPVCIFCHHRNVHRTLPVLIAVFEASRLILG